MVTKIILFDYFKKIEIGKKPTIFINTKVRSLYSFNKKNKSNLTTANNFNFIDEDKHLSKINNIEIKLFPLIINFLNHYHNTEYEERFWKIIIGNWFRKSIFLIYNRYQSLDKILNSKDNFELIFSKNSQSLTYKNSAELNYLNNNIKWNNNIYLKLSKLIGRNNITIKQINYENQKSTELIINKKILKYKILKKIIIYISKFLPTRSNKFLICQTYLSSLNEFFLNLFFLQFPNYYFYTNDYEKIVDKINLSKVKRDNLKILNFTKSLSRKEIIIFKCLVETLPINYLENFKHIISYLNKSNLPISPKLIFTSNLYDSNDYFKIWTSLKVINGTKYIIGQHGNNYFTHKLTQNTIEEEVSDKFVSWGNRKNKSKYLDAFIFKTLPKSNFKNNKKILINMEHLNLSFYSSDPWLEFKNYIEKNINLINSLDIALKKNITIRLHPASKLKEYDFKTNEFIESVKNQVKIDDGNDSINKLYTENKLVIHSYDSTGLLETLAINKPTLCIWNNKIDHVLETMKYKYQLLIDAKILHFNNNSIIEHLKVIYDNIDGWWYSEKTQKNMNEFCGGLINTSDNKIKELKKILLYEINK